MERTDLRRDIVLAGFEEDVDGREKNLDREDEPERPEGDVELVLHGDGTACQIRVCSLVFAFDDANLVSDPQPEHGDKEGKEDETKGVV